MCTSLFFIKYKYNRNSWISRSNSVRMFYVLFHFFETVPLCLIIRNLTPFNLSVLTLKQACFYNFPNFYIYIFIFLKIYLIKSLFPAFLRSEENILWQFYYFYSPTFFLRRSYLPWYYLKANYLLIYLIH